MDESEWREMSDLICYSGAVRDYSGWSPVVKVSLLFVCWIVKRLTQVGKKPQDGMKMKMEAKMKKDILLLREWFKRKLEQRISNSKNE